MIGRALGLTLVAAGIVAGTILGRPAAREIPRANGYFVMAGDFHVHAAMGDGAVPSWELVREAQRRGLDVIVLTNHNQRLAAWVAELLAQNPAPGHRPGPLVIVGQEVTTPGFHLIAAGIAETIDWRLSGSDAIRAIHAQGGVAIAAHPTTRSWRADEGAMSLLDGAEAVHPLALASVREGRQLVEFYRTAASRNPSLAPIGSSDFHFAGTLGECRTYLFVREVSVWGVLDAIREARTVAYGRDGRLFGDPALVAAVKPLVEAHRPPSSSDLASRIAAWVSLLGVFIVLVWK